MKRGMVAALAIVLGGFVAPSVHAAVYKVNFDVRGTSVTGSIVTDQLGRVDVNSLTSYEFDFSGLSLTNLNSRANGTLDVSGGRIAYDFTGTGVNSSTFYKGNAPNVYYVVFLDRSDVPSIQIKSPQGGYVFERLPVGSSFTIATGVPEISTWAMMLLGFGGLGVLGYRKTRKSGAALMLAA